jgi:uncharacterized protein (TIGR01777 family)
MNVLLTGATGTIGRRLVARLPGARVLSRSPERATAALGGVRALPWDGRSVVAPGTLEGVDAVVHLAGEPVAEGRWTPAKKQSIRESRVLGTRALVESLRASGTRPRVLVCASAVGFYGDRGDEVLDEGSPAGKGFLSDVCAAWEAEASAASALGLRVLSLRIGLVLDREGGALARMLTPFRFGLGGPMGDGRQWLPWIHVEDVVGLVLHALEHDVSGAMNAVGPEPVRQVDFARALGRLLGVPAFLKAPRFALRAAFGEMADVLLASQRALPAKAMASGYTFRHPALAGALEDLLLPGAGAPLPL